MHKPKKRIVNSYIPLLSGLFFLHLCDICFHLRLHRNDDDLIILQQGAAWYAVFHLIAMLKILTTGY